MRFQVNYKGQHAEPLFFRTRDGGALGWLATSKPPGRQNHFILPGQFFKTSFVLSTSCDGGSAYPFAARQCTGSDLWCRSMIPPYFHFRSCAGREVGG